MNGARRKAGPSMPERRYSPPAREAQVARRRPVEQTQGESDDVLELQKTAGNRAVSGAIAAQAGQPPVQRLSEGGGAVIQRATFAELMAFWKKQELGQDPAKEESKDEESPNTPPEPEALPEEVKAMNPGIEEEQGEGETDGAQGPVAYQVDGGEDEKQGGQPRGPYAYAVHGAQSGSATGSGGEDEKQEAPPRGPYAYAVHGAQSGSATGGGGAPSTGHYFNPLRGGSVSAGSGRSDTAVSSPVSVTVKSESGGRSDTVYSESARSVTAQGEEQKQEGGATKYAQFRARLPGESASSGSGSVQLSENKDFSSSDDDFSSSDESAQNVVQSPQGPVTLRNNQVAGNKTKVKYLDTAEARKEFQLSIGGSITQGGEPFDTSKMYSKFMGDGFGIYVMGKDGTFYSTSHKIGLFHHSSFLGGGDVAGAGEMKVVGGTLQFITNKSGHYWPGDRELSQTLNELQGASGFSSAGLAQLLPGGGLKNPYEGGPAQFLKDHPAGAMNNKDGIKYTGKAMVMDQSERNDSVGTVRAILEHFVKAARLGKLKKFNKPDPNFGNTLEDIKQLVLAEFGWNEKDVADYEEVLKNWNNDKEIVEIPEGSPPPVQASESWDSDSSSITFNSTATATVSGSEEQKSGGNGRDWDAELQELLQSNPNPDFGGLGLSPYGAGYVIWNEDHTSYRVARAEDKVRLLKGEVTADELRGS